MGGSRASKRAQWITAAGGLAVVVFAAGGLASRSAAAPPASVKVDLVSLCRPEAVSAITAGLPIAVTIKEVPNGPRLPGGVRLTPAAGRVPAFCQVTGSYVTNPKTGKTANFIATFPESWNGKYLQLGCSGTCGVLLMNDPASPPITVTAQGYPGQIMEKGYAAFGDDLGHLAGGPSAGGSDWMKDRDGHLDPDVLEDYLYRADMVLADMGKAFTRAFYSRAHGAPARIARSYFSGCSQGGRNALVAATRFPEKFDGIIAGSPLSTHSGPVWQVLARAIVAQQNPAPAKLTPGQVAMLNNRMAAQCDALDGVKDGLVQNPAACEFNPSRDLPLCKAGETGDSCVSEAQAQNISAFLAGLTDEAGRVIQPGYALGVSSFGYVAPPPAALPMDGDMKFVIGEAAGGRPLATGRTGGPGAIDTFHVVLNGAAFAKYFEVMRRGEVLPEDFAPFFKHNGKLLWYHNLSDEALTPYMSFNRYRRLAELRGGYAKLQQNIRLFTLPGSGHCGLGTGEGPGNFDPLTALEAWVERGVAPNALLARQLDPASSNLIAGKVDWSKPLRTMPLCAFPAMASYKGRGDVKDASNWECRASDERMLRVGESGRLAGALR